VNRLGRGPGALITPTERILLVLSKRRRNMSRGSYSTPKQDRIRELDNLIEQLNGQLMALD
jgi:hypothetical protein